MESEQDEEAPSIGSSSRRRRRRFLLLLAATVGLAALLLIGVWARNFASDDSELDQNFTTTTDPFAHIDRNQSSDVVSADTNAASSGGPSDETQTTNSVGEWRYRTSFDEVRDHIIYLDSVDSQNTVFFDAPYDGGSTLTMTVRRHPEYGDEIMLEISKGQFVCGVEDCSGTINFGAGPEPFSLSEPADHSSDTLFVESADLLIKQLKVARKIVVELPFYQQGNRQFTFEMKNPLAWPPKGSAAKALPIEDDNTVDN